MVFESGRGVQISSRAHSARRAKLKDRGIDVIRRTFALCQVQYEACVI